MVAFNYNSVITNKPLVFAILTSRNFILIYFYFIKNAHKDRYHMGLKCELPKEKAGFS